jgi:hypothetical protein
MIRHQQNTNLHLHYEESYLGFPVQIGKGPLIVEYLDSLYSTMQRSLNEHPRSFAFRADLRFPWDIDPSPYLASNAVVERFIESFKAKIRHNRDTAKRKYGNAHETAVRYVWAREIGTSGRPHFHFAILLNNDAFFTVGKFQLGRENVFNRLHEAWASALGLSISSVVGLVEIPKGFGYHLHRDDPKNLADFFYHASYLCKAATKVYGNGCHGFGSSRC